MRLAYSVKYCEFIDRNFDESCCAFALCSASACAQAMQTAAIVIIARVCSTESDWQPAVTMHRTGGQGFSLPRTDMPGWNCPTRLSFRSASPAMKPNLQKINSGMFSRNTQTIASLSSTRRTVHHGHNLSLLQDACVSIRQRRITIVPHRPMD